MEDVLVELEELGKAKSPRLCTNYNEVSGAFRGEGRIRHKSEVEIPRADYIIFLLELMMNFGIRLLSRNERKGSNVI